MRILVTGASGFIGSALVPPLVQDGHQVIALTRGSGKTLPSVASWDPLRGTLDPAVLEGVDAIVHLAGETIMGRWTQEKKAMIRDSRVASTKLLSESAARLSRTPKVLVTASAVGFYGDRADERLDEASAPGRGFLAETCQSWEAAAQPAAARGVRVVHLRIGVVLSSKGGALSKMLPVFRLGLGGNVGDGRQYWSWVAMEDVVGAFRHALENGALQGPVNVTAPEPVTNAEFTRALGRALHRPVVFPLPAAAARLMMGEMADALLLSSARVEPKALLASGYRFVLPELELALRHLLGS